MPRNCFRMLLSVPRHSLVDILHVCCRMKGVKHGIAASIGQIMHGMTVMLLLHPDCCNIRRIRDCKRELWFALVYHIIRRALFMLRYLLSRLTMIILVCAPHLGIYG